MTQMLYDELWHYSERFTRDKLQRSELISMAYVQGKKMGDRCTPGLMKSVIVYRAKELKFRSAFPTDEMGKSQKDAWNKPERVYLDRKVAGEETNTLADFLIPDRITPLDFAQAEDFMSALTDEERTFLDDLTAGYTLKEISQRQHFTYPQLHNLRTSLEEKAVAYL